HFLLLRTPRSFTLFLVTAPAYTALYPLSLHDALPIYPRQHVEAGVEHEPIADPAVDAHPVRHLVADDRDAGERPGRRRRGVVPEDRKSTRLNSSHVAISYAVFCLKKKKAHKI